VLVAQMGNMKSLKGYLDKYDITEIDVHKLCKSAVNDTQISIDCFEHVLTLNTNVDWVKFVDLMIDANTVVLLHSVFHKHCHDLNVYIYLVLKLAVYNNKAPSEMMFTVPECDNINRFILGCSQVYKTDNELQAFLDRFSPKSSYSLMVEDLVELSVTKLSADDFESKWQTLFDTVTMRWPQYSKDSSDLYENRLCDVGYLFKLHLYLLLSHTGRHQMLLDKSSKSLLFDKYFLNDVYTHLLQKDDTYLILYLFDDAMTAKFSVDTMLFLAAINNNMNLLSKFLKYSPTNVDKVLQFMVSNKMTTHKTYEYLSKM
jgi:hypothetical protein